MPEDPNRTAWVTAALAWIATIFPTAWAAVTAAAFGAAMTALSIGKKWVELPIVHSTELTFISILWTYIGIIFLVERDKTRTVLIEQDLKYGLTFEGVNINVNPASKEAFLQFSLAIRNYSSSAMKYEIEKFDVILENRTLPQLRTKTLYGYLARGGGKTSGREPFRRNDLSAFFGTQAKGELYLSILYGNAEKDFVRRLDMSFDLYLDFTKMPKIQSEEQNFDFGIYPFPLVGFSNNIVSEKDVWIKQQA